ncbi:MAG: Tol-Pal system beta propeller repeat protein TolB [Nitrospirota bacterium]|nr:Tol-Pal system beta propeller repeat protein TolB [Nitrospirota bacterium]MDH5585317.1 Tol-Pal system beta propeller repeat protein TolB [Nitrospirota bacterium]MDH5774150.1 Tol-Pal system beta propeller repeat protein TolB [Nitrospirota bacterium]
MRKAMCPHRLHLLASAIAVLTFLSTPLSFGEDAILEATRSEFQKIPIWVMGFSPVEQDKKISETMNTQVESVLKEDLQRSQVFSVADLPSTKGEFSQNKCVSLSPTLETQFSKVTVSTWGRLGIGGTSNGVEGLIFDACAFDPGHQDVLTGKRYFSLKTNDALLRLMAHRWADELVYRYTGERGIARTKIAFVGEKENGRELFVMDYDGYDPQQVTADGYLNLMPTWSPDRKFLIYTGYRDRKQQIMRRELATGHEEVLVPPASLNITATFAPDGQSITYAGAQEGNSDIYQLALDSGSAKQLTSHHSADLSPSWSPDGRHVAFTSDRGGRPQIYIMDADGSNVKRLTYDGDYNAAPAWSPKGEWIVYVCRIPGEGFKLCRISPNGEQRSQITKGNSIDDSPSWAPNGRHLVFSSIRGGESQIYIVTSEGAGLEKISSVGAHLSSPSWSPFQP